MKSPISKINTMHAQQGLSLIELMVAMTLSLILLAGVTQILIGNKNTFDLTRDLSDVQENGRLALTFVSDSARHADYWAGVTGNELADQTGLGGILGANTTCDSAFVLDTTSGVQGYEGVNAANDPSPCTLLQYVEDSDIVVFRYADGRTAATVLEDDQVYVRTVLGVTGGTPELFLGVNEAATEARLPSTVDQYTADYPYAMELYYLRKCSILVGTDCPATNHTLVRVVSDGSGITVQPLVEGIQQMQFDYGVDTNDDLLIDDYRDANNVADWENVMSVRMSFLSRASRQDGSRAGIQNDDLPTYNMTGNFTYNSASAGYDALTRYRQYDREVHIRNRTRL